MKTYTQQQKNKPFNWNKFLKLAIEGKITEDQKREAIVLADQWTTCACGNQCAIIPRTERGEPSDPRLKDLGLYFNTAIYDGEYQRAKSILAQIEKRSTELINMEIPKQLKRIKAELAEIGFDLEIKP